MFHQLNNEDIKQIAGKMLEQLKARLLENGIEAEFSEDTVTKIAAEGFDPIYGARPIRRVIQTGVEDMIAERMLEGKINEGDKITICVKNDKFDIE